MSPRRIRHPMLVSILCAVSIAALSACNTDKVTAAPNPVEGTLVVDASLGWMFASLRDNAIVNPAPSARESSVWDIAVFATNVTLNGGEAGPGNVTGFCICQNAAATNNEVLAMTPGSELADFDAVTAVPAGAVFIADALTPSIADWFTGAGASAVADPSKTFLVRLADSVGYAKVHVTGIAGATASSAGQVTLEYAVQPSPTAALGATQSVVVDLSAGAKNVKLSTGVVSTTGADWDLRLEGFTIRVNGGVTGPGKSGATLGTGSFASVTNAKTADQAYQIDRYAGVFGAQIWYRYNIAGDNHISPTFDVYLIKRGSAVFKLQIVNYYNTTGQPRFITFRYKQIAT